MTHSLSDEIICAIRLSPHSVNFPEDTPYMSVREIRKTLEAVPIDLKHKCVFLADIPDPYRSEFAHDNQRSPMAIRFRQGRPEPSAYSWDWRNWIEFRCRAERWEPRLKTSAVKVMDDEALEAWRQKVERGLKNRHMS